MPSAVVARGRACASDERRTAFSVNSTCYVDCVRDRRYEHGDPGRNGNLVEEVARLLVQDLRSTGSATRSLMVRGSHGGLLRGGPVDMG